MKICSELKCTGCQACRLSCPVQAIDMKLHEQGYIFPYINDSMCIQCNQCVKVCPENTPVSKNPMPDVAFAGWIKDTLNRKISTSGGISYLLSKRIVEQGGVFCGVRWLGTGAGHVTARSIEGLRQFQGSKYTHSDVGDTYSEIEEFLKKGVVVLFSGTPCQVAGLRSYLKQDYTTLYTIDIVCHGVPSKKLLLDRIQMVETEQGKSVADVRFRDKNPSQYLTCVKYTFTDGTYWLCPVYKDPYFRCFVENYCLRESCYTCQYADIQRVGDITLADFWGYTPSSLKFRSFKKGTSLIIPNNSKGQELLKMIVNDIVYEKRPLSEAVACNRNLSAPQQKPARYDEFWQRYSKGETLSDLCPEFYPFISYKISFMCQVKTLLKMMLPQRFVKIINRKV